MAFKHAANRFFMIVCACMAFVQSPALAREMVSVKGSIVNMRSAPSTRSEVLWELKRGYPLQVLKRQGRWLQVRDFENDRGWVAKALTNRTPHYIVKARVANLRSGPGTRYHVVGKAERYDLLRTRGAKTGWVRVESSNGVTGWVAKRLLWGW
ncbi:SH3 domain-containing protein [Candidatus Accumulibacter sp. ACC003]|uniref:SH3 domain-containing protein n=1 Tax=Candidatus Accumulibacter sp. ACC003 TaxID=2823334 RepID=UPI0025C4327E|nr:SH3 domain-containing protein [Candidatus Accumulibacter sp. ACC003]